MRFEVSEGTFFPIVAVRTGRKPIEVQVLVTLLPYPHATSQHGCHDRTFSNMTRGGGGMGGGGG